MYVAKKDDELIPHELPEYGETVVITMDGKVGRFETKEKRKV